MKSIDKRWSIYNKYYADRQFEREDVFLALKEKYGIESALYPGSFTHITPSFIFPRVAFVDIDKNAIKFFNDIDQVKKMIDTRKIYTQNTNIEFIGQSYDKILPLAINSFDLLFSHYAGIISQPCKKYLKIGGVLLVNNSHADAGVAFLDDELKFIGVVKLNQKKIIFEEDLDQYFIPKRNVEVTTETLIKSGKGIGYKNTADLYIFKKIK